MNTAKTYLELPPGVFASQPQQLLNDRLRTISARLDSIGGGGSNTTTITGGAPTQLIFSVPGVIGIRSSAAPLVTLASTVNTSSIVALLKQASTEADVKIQMSAAGASFPVLVIPVGQTSANLTVQTSIPANTPVLLNIIQVGTKFPGADLTVILRF